MRHDDNTKKLRCFKDALNGRVMTELLGLNLKSYAFKFQHIEKKRAQWVSKAVVDKLFILTDYKHSLITNKSLVINVVSISSFSQQLFTYKQNNIALTSFYDKMKMLDSINCEPYGYIKYENNALTTITINEVEDIQIQEVKHIDVKLPKGLTSTLPTSIILDIFNNHDSIDFVD